MKVCLKILIVASVISATSGVIKIGGETISTLRIIARLCYLPGGHNDRSSARFFECYDSALGKALFFKCQKRVFRNILNTEARIDFACRHPERIPVYAACLMREFRKARINISAAVTKVNVCQGKALGLWELLEDLYTMVELRMKY